jgi:serine/threonine protein phosphatase PrpC
LALIIGSLVIGGSLVHWLIGSLAHWLIGALADFALALYPQSPHPSTAKFTNDAARCIIRAVKPEITVAQLCIVDGAWQETPDNLACFEAAALFEENIERGNLYIVVEVAGEPEGRDALARELIETTRRAYAATRGSIALGLMQAIRAANDFFYTTNANTAPEARRIAGITATILRENELFIAQGGPGVTCLVRDNTLTRYPEESPWFNADEAAVAEWLGTRNFGTPGEVPIGMRRNYLPDIFHVTLRPGDVIVLATRALVHLLTDTELLDTLANRHPDDIVATLEDVAGAADLSVIALRVAGPAPAPQPAETPPTLETPIPEPPPSAPAPSEEELALQQIRAEREVERQRLREEQARARREKIRSGFLRAGAGAIGTLAGLLGRLDWTRAGKAVDRALDTGLRYIARTLAFLIRAVTPGEVKESASKPSPTRETAWKLAALIFPVLLLIAGGVMWGLYRTDQRAATERRIVQLLTEATTSLEEAKRLATTDRMAARQATQRALRSIEQARALAPTDPRIESAYHPAQNLLDELNGISLITTLTPFATFGDAKSKITRIVPRASEVFILDRGLQRVYRFIVNEQGTSATPVSSDGIILKFGDRMDNRTVSEIFDLAWLDAGRLVAVDRAGVYYQFDPNRGTWSARAVNDSAAWARVSLAATYANNLYLIDAPRNQILKYVSPSPEVVWSSAVTYFLPGVIPPDLSTVVDWAIDGEVWLARGDGSVTRFYDGKPKEITLSGFDPPLARPVALCTSERMNALYIADAGNQRLLQFDKATGRLARQFKPHSQARDAFKNLQTFAVDEPSRRFFFVSDGKAYIATIPQ